MNRLVILIILTQLLFSCSNVEKETPQKKEVKTETRVEEKIIPDGDFVQKYPNGGTLIKGQILNNKREGLWTAYYPNGVKQSENIYESGVLHGRTASFYSNGQARYIGYFLGGKKDAKWDFYSDDGKFEKSELYVKGKLTKQK